MNSLIKGLSIFIMLSLTVMTLTARPLEVAVAIDSLSTNNPTCGLENGIITIFASGGANIRYSIDNGMTYQDSNVFENLVNDDYLIVIISGTTCSDVRSVTLLQDNFPPLPVLDCPDLIEVDCQDDPISFITSQIDNIPATNFNDAPLPLSPTSPLADLDISLCGQLQPIELVAIDTCMGRTSCVVQIEFSDDNLPQIDCPDPLDIFIGDPDHIEVVENWEISISGSDPCGGPVTYASDLDLSRINFLCDSFFVIPVVFDGLDQCTNVATCTSQLNVTNELNPVVSCLPDFIIECNADPEEVLDELLVQFEDDPAFDEDVSIVLGSSNIDDIVGLLCGDTISVNFLVEDGCERTTQCATQLMIQDLIPPIQDPCPPNLFIDEMSATTMDNILAWLDSAPRAQDNCSMVDFSTDFDSTLLDDLCNWPDTVTVTFIAADRCGNSTSCESRVFVPMLAVSLSCQDDLIIECGDPNQMQLIDEWLLLAAAVDQDGQTIGVDNNFAGLNLSSGCVDSLLVTFSIDNNCAQSSCMANIVIVDTTNPEIDCPIDETINLSDGDLALTIERWLSTAQSSDQCTVPTEVTYDFNSESVSEIDCSIDTTIVFSVADGCGLSVSCSATLSIINDLSVELECPRDTTVLCASTDVDMLIATVINSTDITAGSAVTLIDNSETIEIDTECNDTQVLSIDLVATDDCDNSDACTFEVTVLPDSRIYQPTIFNLSSSDEANRSFGLFGDASVTISFFQIFDRWGNLVHSSGPNSQPTNNIQWDGRINGREAEQGVYTYIIRYIDISGQSNESIGQFTLLR